MDTKEKIRQEISGLLAHATGMKKEEIATSLESPPDPSFGDFAFPCFPLAKTMRKNPELIADELAGKIKPEGPIKKIEPRGGYVNFFVSWDSVGEDVLSDILDRNDDYGKSAENKETVLMEFCHANTHKAFHIGHTRTLELGESLSKVLEFAGFRVIRTNYQGDIGPHVAKCLWGLINLYSGKEPKDNRGRWLGEVYAAASRKIKDDEQLKEQVDEINKKLYSGDKEILELWKKTRQWSLDYFEGIYRDFGAKFDRLYFESETEKPGTEVAKSLLKKKIAKMSDGAVVVDLEKYGLGVSVLITGQGTPLYVTKDLGLAGMKMKEHKFDRSIHVVGSEQKLYFQQLFKILELMGSPMAKKSYHLCYELVTLAEGKMSSREGVVILYEDLLAELKKHALEETEKRNEDADRSTLERTADLIASAALKYDIIKVSPNKKIVFDWKEALNFEDNAAPYILYSYARARSIMKKAETKNKKPEIDRLAHPTEKELIKMLSDFPGTVQKAARDLRPHYIANYAYDLSVRFNEFYNNMPVLKAPDEERDARLVLVESSAIVMKNALRLIGIEPPERM